MIYAGVKYLGDYISVKYTHMAITIYEDSIRVETQYMDFKYMNSKELFEDWQILEHFIILSPNEGEIRLLREIKIRNILDGDL